MKDGFYRAFEERHYAPREVIQALRRQYLPFVEPLARLHPGAATFDLGCGRGEWLELMTELGFAPFGVDLDEGMLSDCAARGLPAERGDAVVALAALPDASRVVVSAFHVVEHLEFEQLRTVVVEALRVLVPGGLLILETPNPENLVVGTAGFYLDPTHRRPIPPGLLAFLPEYYGFERVKTLRLQGSVRLDDGNGPTLLNVLNGASPDCAVVAQKSGGAEALAATAPAFDAEYGVTLEALADAYERRVAADLRWVREERDAAHARVRQAEAAVETVYRSRSWQLTRPLRWAGRALRSVRARLGRREPRP